MNIVKMIFFLSIWSKGSMHFSLKFHWYFLRELGSWILKFIWKSECPWITKKILEKENNEGDLALLNAKLNIKLQKLHIITQKWKMAYMEQNRV